METTAAPARVLIADDNSELLDFLRHALKGSRFHCEFARDGQEALDYYHAARDDGRPYDLLVLDSAMPHLSGLAVTEAVRKIDAQTSVVLFTADPSPLVYARASLCNIGAIWVKPEGVVGFAARIEDCLCEKLKL